MTQPDLDALDLGAAPQASIDMWLRAVRTMDRNTLDSFVRHTWRTWSADSLRPLGAAVDARRSELDGE